jgi:tRNA threonylcarbamoyl adenosine modification protein (Sua5/YciO/YrdC/YwlC family)
MDMARMLKVNPHVPHTRLIDMAAESLAGGGLISYPTDTAYGIGSSLVSKRGIERIYMLKPHKKKKPLTFLCSDLKDISRYAHVSDEAYRIMKRLTPGPFTFILHATREVPKLVMTPRKTVGIRVPDNTICQALIRTNGNPIISTTAMTQSREYIDDPDEIMKSLGHALDYVIDGGRLTYALSTVLDLTDGAAPVIIRQGRGVLPSNL